MKNTFGSDLSLTIFGESHGRAIGAVLDGMAAGVPVDEAFLAACMDKRRARGDGLSTPRVEADTVQLLSGVVNGRTTGTAIALMIENTNTRSGDYAKTADLLRPGHADYTAYAKYHGFQDARGGGHFSGRVTAAFVAGGAIVLSALHRAGIDITTHIAECAGIADTRFAQDDAAQLSAQVEALASKPEGFAVLDETVEEPMKAAIRAAGAEGDSVGGMLETAILGLPAGIGEPYFDSVESPPLSDRYTDETAASTRSAQALLDLPETGVADAETWTAVEALSLQLAAVSPNPDRDAGQADVYPGRAMKEGSVGPDVGQIEQWLNGRYMRICGEDYVTENFRFGPKETEGVRAAQERADLLVTGTVNEETWAALRAQSCECEEG